MVEITHSFRYASEYKSKFINKTLIVIQVMTYWILLADLKEEVIKNLSIHFTYVICCVNDSLDTQDGNKIHHDLV